MARFCPSKHIKIAENTLLDYHIYRSYVNGNRNFCPMECPVKRTAFDLPAFGSARQIPVRSCERNVCSAMRLKQFSAHVFPFGYHEAPTPETATGPARYGQALFGSRNENGSASFIIIRCLCFGIKIDPEAAFGADHTFSFQ